MSNEITETDDESATDELRAALLALLKHGYTTSGYDRVVDCLGDCERLANTVNWSDEHDEVIE